MPLVLALTGKTYDEVLQLCQMSTFSSNTGIIFIVCFGGLGFLFVLATVFRKCLSHIFSQNR